MKLALASDDIPLSKAQNEEDPINKVKQRPPSLIHHLPLNPLQIPWRRCLKCTMEIKFYQLCLVYFILNWCSIVRNSKNGEEAELMWKEQPVVYVGTVGYIQEEDSEDVAMKLSNLGEQCLTFINNHSRFKEKYRIEIRPVENEWKLYLHLDPVAWFDALYLSERTEIVLEKSRKYVDNINKSFHPPNSEILLYDSIPSRQYCTYHAECLKCE